MKEQFFVNAPIGWCKGKKELGFVGLHCAREDRNCDNCYVVELLWEKTDSH